MLSSHAVTTTEDWIAWQFASLIVGLQIVKHYAKKKDTELTLKNIDILLNRLERSNNAFQENRTK